jgi:hypothetical protein
VVADHDGHRQQTHQSPSEIKKRKRKKRKEIQFNKSTSLALPVSSDKSAQVISVYHEQTKQKGEPTPSQKRQRTSFAGKGD